MATKPSASKKTKPVAVKKKSSPAQAEVKPKKAVAKAGAANKVSVTTTSTKSKSSGADTKSKPVKKAPPLAKGGKKESDDGYFIRFVDPKDAQEMMTLLCQTYPDADCELDYDTDFQLLTSVIMSAQTTDVQVNKVTPELFRRFPDAKALADADIEEVKVLIKPTGYFNAKAQSIQNCAKALVEKFNGQVPDNLDELVTLPGVGRKTANVLLGVIHKVPAWTCDTHVQRLSKRLGFSDEIDPYKLELALQKLFPEKNWTQYSITLIWHGRRLCYARKPDCPKCPINHLCPSAEL